MEANERYYTPYAYAEVKESFFPADAPDYNERINLIAGKGQAIIAYGALTEQDKTVQFNTPDAENRLTDGILAKEATYSDPAWFRFTRGVARSIIFDIGAVAAVSELSIRFLKENATAVRLPNNVSFSVSVNGVDFAQAAIADGKTQGDVLLTDLMGKSYDDPLWDKLLDQLTLLEMQDLVNYAGWQTLEIPYIGKPASRDTDGPKGWTGSNIAGEAGNMFCSEPVIAATFNVDLIYEIGKNVGDQGLWGSSDRTDGGLQEAYTCWYAPGMNIHRGAFDSRFIEYYSEDPVLTGKAAAAISLGLKEKGAYMTMKHFALHNDGSTVRASFFGTGYDGLSAWVNEQALREVYLRGYEICVEEGDAISAMSSFTRFGNTWAGASYSLCTELYRNEWGCNGYIVTDIVLTDFQDGNQGLRAGNDCLLTATFVGDVGMVKLVDDEGNLLPESERNCELTATQVSVMRKAAKHILWSVVNSNAMQAPMGSEIRYTATESAINAVEGTAVDKDLATAVLGTRNEYGTISYAVTDGALPAGVTLSEEGKLSGTPTAAGTYTFTVTASADNYISDSVTYTIAVTAPVQAPMVVGFLLQSQSMTIHVIAAIAVATWVTRKAFAASPSAASPLPALKPNHPSHRNEVPMKKKVTLCGVMGCPTL